LLLSGEAGGCAIGVALADALSSDASEDDEATGALRSGRGGGGMEVASLLAVSCDDINDTVLSPPAMVSE
jgi:hypothetical protein